ncbi:MAG TPA: glutathione S-transferase family protein [Kofleriaceae bacterium]|nr:glutathione S-transferase family protein [Kofleriaceae bacterium]
MAIRLYSWPRSSGTRVHWALEELGLPYEYVELDRQKGEHRAPDYLAVNPNAKVPAIADGDERLFESVAILIHLGERYGVAKGLWPKDGPAHADALSWIVWSTTELHAFMMQYAYHGLDTPVSYKAEDRSKAAADYNKHNFDRHLDMLEARLAGRQFIMGDFSLVDIPAAATLRFGSMIGVSLDGKPNVAAWLERCTKRPAVARTR